ASPKTCQLCRAPAGVCGRGRRLRGTADGYSGHHRRVVAVEPVCRRVASVCRARERQVTISEVPAAPASTRDRGPIRVRRRSGASEPVDVDTIVRAVARCADGLDDVDPQRVAAKTISGLYDGVTEEDLDRLVIQTAADLIGEEPQYSKLAARLLSGYIDQEVRG